LLQARIKTFPLYFSLGTIKKLLPISHLTARKGGETEEKGDKA